MEMNYTEIRVSGGGRICLELEEKSCNIFGFSYGFGKADHEFATEVVRADARYADFEITWSDDGY